MLDFLLWYIVITLLGLVSFPLLFASFGRLPDRGYTLSRVFGLLFCSFIFWISTSLQINTNTAGGILLSIAILLVISIYSARKYWQDIIEWVKQYISYIVFVEFLFVGSFAFWAFIRAANPEIIGTEKPMELAFINAILRSSTFPPHDPWLSGYAISYYYFGYVMVAMLARLTAVEAQVAFNLAVSLWFGLTFISAFGISYNLLRSAKFNSAINIRYEAWALLGPFFVLTVSNIEGFLEMLHARGIFWVQTESGELRSVFWQWLNIQELNLPPAQPFSWIPERVSGIWWWRASRVLQDFDMAGNSKEIIDEFPFFSYLLADLHPHLLSMPFVLLAVGLALNLYLNNSKTENPNISVISWLAGWLTGSNKSTKNLPNFYIIKRIRQAEFWFAGLILGGLAFINIWDFPFYLGLYCAVNTLLMYRREGWSINRIFEFIELGLALGIAGVFLYLPFYVGFSSQAGGILPSLSFFTRGRNFWVMFLPLLFPILLWLILVLCTKRDKVAAGLGLKISIAIIGGLWLFSYLFGWLIVTLGLWAQKSGTLEIIAGGSNIINKLESWIGLFYGLHGTRSSQDLITGSLFRRVAAPGTWLTLLLLLTLVWGMLAIRSIRSHGFVLLMILLGIGLALTPEFVYLRDQFGWRINTIFKFYFQVWILWGLAAAYGSVFLLNLVNGWSKYLLYFGWLSVILLSFAYPIFSLWTKTNGFKPDIWTLDGTAYLADYSPDEMEAFRWLEQAPLGVVAEAVGGSYSAYARVSTHTGQKTVLGWPGHESQWRGGAKEMGSRETEIETLYRTSNWEEAKSILDEYRIRYVYIGSLERTTYRVNEAKFLMNLKLSFQNNTVIIYEYLTE